MSLEISSKNMDYYGIISTLCRDIGLIEIIDETVGIHPKQKVTCGEASLAMILNMLAVHFRPLYLISKFMRDKPVNRLIGEHLSSEMFNDDVLGRTLDKLHDIGLEELFMKIAASSYAKYDEFLSPFLHGDTTSMHVHGNYGDPEAEIAITYGYSKNKRTDLKQFVVSMITCDNLPVFISTIDGNTSDRKYFRELLKEYGAQVSSIFKESKTFVFDSAFYSEASIKSCDFPWITRVPENITEAKDLLYGLDTKEFRQSDISGYKYVSRKSVYGGVEQRWIIIRSQQAYKREKETLKKLIDRAKLKIEKEVWHFSKQTFMSEKDGRKIAGRLEKKWKYHKIKGFRTEIKLMKKTKGRGRPKKYEEMVENYIIHIDFERAEDKIRAVLKKKGRFVIATNVSEDKLDDIACLKAYKDQQKVERGFRFIKDPMFFVDAIYLKNVKRIMSIVMLMGISLLIFSLAEKKIRKAFVESGEEFANDTLRPTKKPTIRRIFEVFVGIHLQYYSIDGEVISEQNLNWIPEHHQVLRLMGPEYVKIYEDRGDRIEFRRMGG